MFPGSIVLVENRHTALEAASLARPVTLLSPVDAAATLGPLWWHALITDARARATAPLADILDCGAAPGHAMAALRCGCMALILAPGPASARVAGTAHALGAVILDQRPPAMTILDWRRG